MKVTILIKPPLHHADDLESRSFCIDAKTLPKVPSSKYAILELSLLLWVLFPTEGFISVYTPLQ